MRLPCALLVLALVVVTIVDTRRSQLRARSGRSSFQLPRNDRSQGAPQIAPSTGLCDQSLAPKKRLVCYYRVEENFRPYDLDPCLCTHVVYSYVALKENFAFIAGKKGDLKFLANLKEQNPALKVLVSLRPSEKNFTFEPNPNSTIITLATLSSPIAGSQRTRRNGGQTLSGSALRSKFARRIKEFLARHNLDGVDLDWEFFRETDKVAASRHDLLVSVVRTLRTTFRPAVGPHTAPQANNFLITVTTSKFPRDLTDNYDFSNLHKYVDFVNLPAFSYDSQGKAVRHPARLHGISDMENADSLVDLVLALGLPHDQLTVGVPSHGVLYKLSNGSLTTPGSPAVPWNYNDAIISHSKICAVRDTANWTMVREKDLTAPYIFNKDKWIGFDDEISIKLKAKYIVLRKLGGIAFWSPNDDDPTGKCGLGAYPLLQAIRSVLARPTVDINYSNRTLSNITAPSSFVAIIEKYGNVDRVSDEDYGDTPVPLPCSRPGYLKHPKDCSRFYRCVKFDEQESGAVQRFQYGCPPGLVFDEEYEICNWPSWSPTCTGSGEILEVTKKKFSCPSYGYFQDPNDCAFFYYCSDFGKANLQAYEFKCPFDLAFDEEKLLCNWKWLVKGCTEAVNPESVDLNNFPHFSGDHASLDANNQDLDGHGNNGDLMERRSDDSSDVEFVDSPAEHRSADSSSPFSFSKAEGGRKGFARAIKDAVTDALENVQSKVKSALGIQPQPDKRQDYLDMMTDESIVSNWFSALNPFSGYANQFAHQVGKTVVPTRIPHKKGEQFVSIPILEVIGDKHLHPKGPGGRDHRRPPPHAEHLRGERQHGERNHPERHQNERKPRPGGPEGHPRFPGAQPVPNNFRGGPKTQPPGHRGHPQKGERERERGRPSGPPVRHTPRPLGHREQRPPPHHPGQSLHTTGRPKKHQKNPELIPVPILTMRETPKPGDYLQPIQRRPDNGLHFPLSLMSGSTPRGHAPTHKPTRKMSNPHHRGRGEPEPEPKQRHRGRPEPEPEPEPQRKRKPQQQPPPPQKHLGHGGHHAGQQTVIAEPSINYAQREPPTRFNSLPHKEQHHHRGHPQKQRPKGDMRPHVVLADSHPIVEAFPQEIYNNYDIDVKALNVRPLFGEGGNVDLTKLQYLPAIGEAIADMQAGHGVVTKRPFGLPSAQSPGHIRVPEPAPRDRRPHSQPPTKGTTRKPLPPPPSQQRHRSPQQPVQQNAPQATLSQQQHQQNLNLNQHLHYQAAQLAQLSQFLQQSATPPVLVAQTPIPLPRPSVAPSPRQPQFEHHRQNYYQGPKQNLAPQLHQDHHYHQQQGLPQTITKNGFKPISPMGAGQYSQQSYGGPSMAELQPLFNNGPQPSGSNYYQTYSESPSLGYSQYSTSANTKAWTPSSTTRRPVTSATTVTKTTKSSLLIIPVPDDHPKANSLNDIIRISKDYPHLFPSNFDFSRVSSVTRTESKKKAEAAAVPSVVSYPGQQQQQPQSGAKNDTKSDYIMVVVNEEVGHQDVQALPTVKGHQRQTSTTTTPRPSFVYSQQTSESSKTKSPVVIKLEIPEDKPEVVKSIVDKVKESLISKSSVASPVYVSVTSGASSSSPAPGSTEGDNFFENKNIPQSLYESIQQVIAQHLYQQSLHGTTSTSTTAAHVPSSSYSTSYHTSFAPSSHSTSSVTESKAYSPAQTTVPTTQPPPTARPVVDISSPSGAAPQAIVEQIQPNNNYNYYYLGNETQVPSWPYVQQPAWFQHPAYAPYYPQPVYGPVGGGSGNASVQAPQQPYYAPYPAYGAYQPQWPTQATNGSGYAANWYEWPYVGQNQAVAPSIRNETTLSGGDPQRLSSFYITTTITTQVPPATEAPTTVRYPAFEDSVRVTTGRPNTAPPTWYTVTTPPPTVTSSAAESVTEGAFDLLRTKAVPNNSDAPQIQVYIVQGPNGPQVQTKTVQKDGQKSPNVQVYVIDENSKDKGAYNHYHHGGSNSGHHSPDLHKAGSGSSNQYYQYSHSNYHQEESQINRQTTNVPEEYQGLSELPGASYPPSNQYWRDIEYEDDDQVNNYGTADTATVRSPYQQFLPANKVQSLQSIYNSQAYPGLRNFTDGSVPESACTRPGLFQHPNDCNKFYECYFDRFVAKFTLHLFECPVKLAFDSRIVGCSGPSDPTVCVQY